MLKKNFYTLFYRLVNDVFCKKHFFIETITISLVEYNALKVQISELQKQIRLLQAEIRLLKNGHNSHTSSTPPSHDIGRSNQKSLRKKSFRKRGGQPGHEDSTLQMTENPDKIIEGRFKL